MEFFKDLAIFIFSVLSRVFKTILLLIDCVYDYCRKKDISEDKEKELEEISKDFKELEDKLVKFEPNIYPILGMVLGIILLGFVFG